MKAATWIGIGVLGIAAAVLAWRGRAPAGPGPGAVHLVVSGNTSGFLVPCGCASKQLGGLPRRATALRALPEEGRLYLDAGGITARASEYDRLKAEFLWEGMKAMGLSAANLGGREIALGRETLERRTDLPFVSANVVGAFDGRPPAPPVRRFLAAGARVGVTGVCSESHPAGADLKVLDPVESLRGLLAELRGSCDLVVLLVDAGEEEVNALVEAFPELDAVLTAGQSQPIAPRMVHGRTLLAGAGVKGKFLPVARFEPSGGRWKFAGGRVEEMAETIADDPRMVDLLRRYQEELARRQIPPEASGEVAALLSTLPPGYRYAGSASCTACHEADGGTWEHSKHAHGLDTLRGKRFDADPFCLRCHTTGYGGPGGYRVAAATPLLGGIGCESCHGPSQAHVEKPEVRTPAPARNACLTCHDADNSPTFEHAAYWARIAHGPAKK